MIDGDTLLREAKGKKMAKSRGCHFHKKPVKKAAKDCPLHVKAFSFGAKCRTKPPLTTSNEKASHSQSQLNIGQP